MVVCLAGVDFYFIYGLKWLNLCIVHTKANSLKFWLVRTDKVPSESLKTVRLYLS